MNLVETVAEIDQKSELHTVRLLILLNAFSGNKRDGCIQGITKLAKLDFLLRYPVMLQRALKAKGKSIREVGLEEHEIYSVESTMVRYRFGPWDHRYRFFLNSLVAKGLASISIEGRTVVITISKIGQKYANELSKEPIFDQYTRRSILLKRHFDLTATNLMNFIYETFPEVISLSSGALILP